MEEKNNLNIENEAADKKAKKKWSKKKKVGVSCLVIVLLAAITAFSFIIVAPAAYLANKYDEPIYEYKIQSFTFPSILKEEPTFLIPYYYLTCPRWEVKKDGRQFNIEFGYDNTYTKNPRYKYTFFDDYQLEDVEKWVTEYLQKNIYENIDGVHINAHNMIMFYNNEVITPKTALDVFTVLPKHFENRINKNNKEQKVIYISKEHFEQMPTEGEITQINDRINAAVVEELEVNPADIEFVICIVNSKASIRRHNCFFPYSPYFANESFVSYDLSNIEE